MPFLIKFQRVSFVKNELSCGLGWPTTWTSILWSRMSSWHTIRSLCPPELFVNVIDLSLEHNSLPSVLPLRSVAFNRGFKQEAEPWVSSRLIELSPEGLGARGEAESRAGVSWWMRHHTSYNSSIKWTLREEVSRLLSRVLSPCV